jgi:hypothetical protein
MGTLLNLRRFFMKWTTEQPAVPITPTMLGNIITGRINLYERLGWLTDVTDADTEALIKEAQAAEQRIIAAGLNPKPHGVYRIGIIPAFFSALHPHILRKTLRNLMEGQDNDWGYVDSDYYGEESEPKVVPHGLTEADIGKIFFLVEDKDAPGHNPGMPGSLLSGMRWGEERDAAWAEWKQKFAAAGTVKALNYAAHGLIWLGDIGNWNDAFGSIGYYDYIEQPYDAGRDLCPYGFVRGGGVLWGACYAGAHSGCAAVPVVW